MVKEIQNKHNYGPKTVLHGHLYWWQCFIFFAGGSWQIFYDTSFFWFQVLCNQPCFSFKSALFDQCNMSNGYKKGPYSPIQWAMSSSVGFFAPSLHTQFSVIQLVPGQFCALPSECLALWQRQQLNVSVCHASSVEDMLGANMSCHCW